MIDVDEWLRSSSVTARMVMQVHDELVFEVHQDAVDSVREEIIKRMSGAAKLTVPLEVDAAAGANWDEAH